MYEIIGVNRVDYTSRKSGRPVKGWQIHTKEPVNGTYDGYRYEAIYVSDVAWGDHAAPAVGEMIELVYNRYGQVSAVR